MDRESRTLKFAGLNASALDWKKQRQRKREQTKTFALIHFSRHPLSSLFFHFFCSVEKRVQRIRGKRSEGFAELLEANLKEFNAIEESHRVNRATNSKYMRKMHE